MLRKSSGSSGVAKLHGPSRLDDRNQRPEKSTYHCFPLLSKKTSDSVFEAHCSAVRGTSCKAGSPSTTMSSDAVEARTMRGMRPAGYGSGFAAARASAHSGSLGSVDRTCGRADTGVHGTSRLEAVSQRVS